MEEQQRDFERILVVGTGALGVAFLPFWINWLGNSFPDMEKRFALTRSACRFVSPDAVAVLSGKEVFIDDWNAFSGVDVPHVDIAEWADLILVHPATLNFVGRFALGVADTPLMVALQTTRALVGVAPSLPPGALGSPVVQGHLAALRERPGVVLAPTIPARSARTGEVEDGGSAPLNELYDLCVAYRKGDAGVGTDGARSRVGAGVAGDRVGTGVAGGSS
ncbi:peptide terminal cysteine decarboxylase LxmD [Streptomyces globisporus]|uniref:peptide terminal cysteine decarboxylase LxmD n=1 Tax=Streptomyces TaxID=1883 RepID=UPI0005CA797B|nr:MULTISPECIES: peptide terminal cysteine decarboxylase LxmD [Streptomyces]PPA40999.1 phosphopantothenoylcysteine decarboxylase [Streptomyces griseus]RAN18343.1 phosphopantothenoylcysteine decarboxylase [Streptomyces badius]AWL87154.1 phosphopantothenoylcysteine decarboxylase [Streptomyces globisporus]RAN26225.1 phosphopantothenoylcysteine decarboxylase [Streptomyces badius]UIZ14323.1 peptide terminal cysteine decarboxylase LxmD [Streptomyces sp. R527F]